MRRRIAVSSPAVFLLCAALAALGSAAAQPSPALPTEVRSALDRMHPAWRVASVGDDVRAAIGSRLGPTPNVIAGDFDGDGRTDVAVMLEYPNVDEPQKAFTHYIEIIAFLHTARGYEPVRLEDRSPGPHPILFLTLQRRGTQGFDFEANKRFVYPNDSVGVWFLEKGGGSYIYDKGKFRYVLEAD